MDVGPQTHTFCRLEKGTTYNSYIIYGDKTALVDASHEKFRGLYMNTLKQELKSKGRSLDYIVVSHTEPDHSGESRAPELTSHRWGADPRACSCEPSCQHNMRPRL